MFISNSLTLTKSPTSTSATVICHTLVNRSNFEGLQSHGRRPWRLPGEVRDQDGGHPLEATVFEEERFRIVNRKERQTYAVTLIRIAIPLDRLKGKSSCILLQAD